MLLREKENITDNKAFLSAVIVDTVISRNCFFLSVNHYCSFSMSYHTNKMYLSSGFNLFFFFFSSILFSPTFLLLSVPCSYWNYCIYCNKLSSKNFYFLSLPFLVRLIRYQFQTHLLHLAYKSVKLHFFFSIVFNCRGKKDVSKYNLGFGIEFWHH